MCPGYEFSYDSLNLEIFGRKPENMLIGNSLNCYAGFSTNESVRFNSSSGGLITQILIFALEKGIIDGALVIKMNKDKPLEPEPFIARTKEEIIEAAQSKYCPVPANVAVKQIIDSNPNEKFAVVGLPCHINGIRKAQQINKKLKNNIVFCLGILCNHTPNFLATDLFLQRYNVKKEDIIKIDYRGNGWPGFMRIETTKSTLKISLGKYWWFIGSHFFYPKSCLTCSDGFCELSDASFGDAWLPEYSHDNKGTSVVVTRTEKMSQLLCDMKNELELIKIDDNRITQSQMGMLYFKKKSLNARLKFISNSSKSQEVLNPDLIDYILSIYVCFTVLISSNPIIRKMLAKVPLRVMWLYKLPYSIIVNSINSKNMWKKN
ncbi:MAG: Coenzyme F420 hydrogenase/dehydrogenase, beta subunit C-terminal domain [Methanosarcina barkeri]|nr:Coenzyme F420 hydrogenase/dehydrogenase, beta subunit C-terminal domain [Methanosarcina sp. ERenArc_MAG2]